MPLQCGKSSSSTPGAFVDHETWGPLYIEQDMSNADKLLVFKLNDGLKILNKK